MDPFSNIPWTAQSEYRALPSVVLLSRRWWLFFFVGALWIRNMRCFDERRQTGVNDCCMDQQRADNG
ncbi:hypothetical protein ACRW24_20275 [Escherichia coli]